MKHLWRLPPPPIEWCLKYNTTAQLHQSVSQWPFYPWASATVAQLSKQIPCVQEKGRNKSLPCTDPKNNRSCPVSKEIAPHPQPIQWACSNGQASFVLKETSVLHYALCAHHDSCAAHPVQNKPSPSNLSATKLSQKWKATTPSRRIV